MRALVRRRIVGQNYMILHDISTPGLKIIISLNHNYFST
jgi:hypothetical protein